MAYKTMLRQIISKWGIMSIDLQTALDSDMTVINEDGTHTYVESPELNQDETFEEVAEQKMEEAESQPEKKQQAVTSENPKSDNSKNESEGDFQKAFFNY